MRNLNVWSILLLIALASATVRAVEISEHCRGDEHRQFDFWLGAWEVHGADGQLAGHNDIRRVAGGCALQESWRGVRGGEGMSINSYDADTKRWTQRWVGVGVTLWLEGGFEEGRMVLTSPGQRSTPRGPVIDRISWSALDDGRVRQLWEVSGDHGASWQTIFEGLYSRLGPATGDNTALVRQVADTERAFAKTMADRDYGGFQSFIADDAIFLTGGGDALRGKATIAARWKRFFDGPAAPFAWDPEHVIVLDDGTLAQTHGPVMDVDGRIVSRFQSVWRRESSGEWRVVFDNGYPVCPVPGP